MSDVLVQGPKDYSFPIIRADTEEDDEFPNPPDRPIEPIHALQLFFLPFLLGYLLLSLFAAIMFQSYILLGISGFSIIVLIVGRMLEKICLNNFIKRRTIAIRVLGVEIVLFFIWQSTCVYLYY
ncbi:hypothetical protein NEF87_002152 [Candidatus Lokiarchaeum ossiferum]|uniref:Uncharacterized protein n=1 Tax=Candidatus Lokiarchaeum ossiferum TaxID=2951803 RepID=A0ABY6HSN5_9ARCH|nr:hypothetical protein NEF87_002152 [Candidatus Lokiarchaeum sp. B-35]